MSGSKPVQSHASLPPKEERPWLRPAAVRIGWGLYIGFLLTGFWTSNAIVTSAMMTLAAFIIVRAGSGDQRIAGAIALVFAFGMTLFFIEADRAAKERGREMRAQFTVADLVAAIKQYRAEYQSLSTGSQAEITGALTGNNLRKIVFFESHPWEFSATGELLDPWGTPYHFDLSDPKNPRIYSFGKNKRDDHGAPGSDDICSWNNRHDPRWDD